MSPLFSRSDQISDHLFKHIYIRYTPLYDKKRHPVEKSYALCEDEVHFSLVCPLYQD